MSGKYQAYPEYKNSGIEWYHQIPTSWSVIRLKRAIDQVSSGTSVNSVDAPATDQQIGVLKTSCVYDGTFRPNENKSVVAEDLDRVSCPVVSGSLIVSRMNTPDLVGSAGLVSSDHRNLFLPDRLWQIVFKTAVPAFVHYWTHTTAYRSQVKMACTGTSSSMQNLSQDQFGAFEFVSPPITEQRTIAAFLDHETARIDQLIEKQQRLIELLKEKRQAVISHAVTKGLDPNAPMKDSGVEWLGQVPEHWVVCRLKHVKHPRANSFVDGPFGSNLKSEHFVSDGDVYVIESNFATTGLLMRSKLKTISEDHFLTIKRSEAEEGDIIIAKIGARYGSSAILPSIDKKAVVSGNSLKLTINKEICIVEYANLLLKHLKNEEAMDDGVNVTAQPALSLGALNNLPFLSPPLDEQSKILSYLDRTSELLDKIISKSELSIQLSRERRTALISAAVTGKIDVRNWQPHTITQATEPNLPMAAEQSAEYRV